jgi:hypothetical protein
MTSGASMLPSVAVLFGLGFASADPLPPGATVTPPPAMTESGSLLAFVPAPFSDSEFTGELNEAVFRESAGTLDFAYQIQDSGATALAPGETWGVYGII